MRLILAASLLLALAGCGSDTASFHATATGPAAKGTGGSCTADFSIALAHLLENRSLTYNSTESAPDGTVLKSTNLAIGLNPDQASIAALASTLGEVVKAVAKPAAAAAGVPLMARPPTATPPPAPSCLPTVLPMLSAGDE